MTLDSVEVNAAVTLLIVEDSAVQRVMLERLLRKVGYSVVSAKDGVEGLAVARAHQPSLVISDIAMPNMDGYEMCRAIKSDPDLRHIPVLLLTGLDDPKEVLCGLDAGADNYLTKPVEDAHLLERIHSLLVLSEDGQLADGSEAEGLQVSFAGEVRVIRASRRQTLNLLLSTYESAVRKNRELIQAQTALQLLTEHLEDEVQRRTRQLEVANRVKTEFMANISHEVRTPMNAIIGMTDIVLNSTLDAQQRDMLNIARTSSDKLLQLLNSLLDFSRMEDGKVKIQLDLFALRQALREHLTRFLARFLESVTSKGLAFRCQVDPNVPDALLGDFPLVGKILNPLLDNALKFTERGTISLEVTQSRATADQTTLRFSVTDTGVGIAPEQQEWVFESFSQGDGSKTRKYGGTGLGLSLAKRLAEIMGGQLGFQSELGRGSVFYLDVAFSYDAHGVEAVEGDGVLLQTSVSEFGEVDGDAQSPQPAMNECHRLLKLCEQAIQMGQMDSVDRLVVPLKEAGTQLPSDVSWGDFSKNVLRMVMAARNSDVTKAMTYLEQARADLLNGETDG